MGVDSVVTHAQILGGVPAGDAGQDLPLVVGELEYAGLRQEP